jgi:cobalt-zinc-cadmium efflux system protein
MADGSDLGHEDHEGHARQRDGSRGPVDASGRAATGHDHGGHAHSHGAGLARAGERYRTQLLVAFALTAGFLVVEAVAGVLTGSLALLSDAGHMLTDVIGLGMALAAIELASQHERRVRDRGAGSSRHTFGLYRLEILAAFVNSLLLLAVAGYVLFEAVRRLAGDQELDSGPMLVVAVVGLAVNLTAFLLLRSGAKESLNVEGATLEVLADTIGSAGVIVAALLVQLFGWTWADPLIGAALGVWIVPRAWRLLRQTVRILLQSAPGDVDLTRMRGDLAAIGGVVDVHDLHVWTLTSDMEAVSAHLMTEVEADAHAVLDQARDLVADRYGIHHGTFQVEPETHGGCREVAW